MQENKNSFLGLKDWLKNLKDLREYSFVYKTILFIKSTKPGEKLVNYLKETFPKLQRAPNHLSWIWNRFRNPDTYIKFADERKWVFLVGCTNSGTTLLHDLLAHHPDIASLPFEGQFISNALPLPGYHGCDRVWSENLKVFRMTEASNKDILSRIIHDWKNYLNRVEAPVVIEKSPPNTLRVRWLQSAFKKSYFIGLVRDGRAVAEGISRRKKGVINIKRAAAHWIKTNNILLDDAKQLNKFFLVRYEELVANPADTIKEIFRFIEEDPEKYQFDLNSQLDIHNINNLPNTITNFNQKSFDRIPKDKFEELTAQIQPTMKRLGYAD